MSGNVAIEHLSFTELETEMKKLKQRAIKKVAEAYPLGVKIIFSHGLEKREAQVWGHSPYEMKIRVLGKSGKYWIDTHRIIKAVCPKCKSGDWETGAAGGHNMIPEQEFEICHACGYQWNHR